MTLCVITARLIEALAIYQIQAANGNDLTATYPSAWGKDQLTELVDVYWNRPLISLASIYK